MRNLIILTVSAVAAGGLLTLNQTSLNREKDHSVLLTSQIAESQTARRAASQQLEKLKERTKSRESELASVNADIHRETTARAAVPQIASGPEAEGFWPEARPYFYIAKDHIPSLDYEAFSSQGRVTAEAAALFGITTSEKREINKVVQELFDEIRTREVAAALPTNTPAFVEAQRQARKHTFFLPPLENSRDLMERGGRRVMEILGADRGPLFLERASAFQQGLDSFSHPNGRLVTLIPQSPVRGEIIVSAEGSTSFNTYDLSQDQDWMQFQYGHLVRALLPADSLGN